MPVFGVKRLAGCYLATVVALAIGGCKPGPDSGGEPLRHEITGVVVKVDADRGTLLVDHDEIPGYMPPMTMEFHVSAGDLAIAREGAKIRATMYQATDGFYLEQIWPLDETADKIVTEAARVLRQDTTTRGSTAYRAVGENLPDFALYNQNGEVAQPSQFRGRQVVVNFIFTRCPDPNMCPLATMKMMQLQVGAAEAGIADLELISITLDPEFDTPGVLKAFAEARGIDTTNFSFLTGPEGAIKDLMAQLGVLAFQDGPLIKHTLATILIDREGKIIHRADGSQWDPEEFLDRMRPTETSS